MRGYTAKLPTPLSQLVRMHVRRWRGHKQQRRLLHSQPAKCLFAQQRHRPTRYRRQYHHSVRRLWRRYSKLLADHTGMELPGPAVPTARQGPQRWLDISWSPTDFV